MTFSNPMVIAHNNDGFNPVVIDRNNDGFNPMVKVDVDATGRYRPRS